LPLFVVIHLIAAARLLAGAEGAAASEFLSILVAFKTMLSAVFVAARAAFSGVAAAAAAAVTTNAALAAALPALTTANAVLGFKSSRASNIVFTASLLPGIYYTLNEYYFTGCPNNLTS
jgi:hypothetical protein